MTGVELDFVVKDSLQALAVYEAIFDLERIEVTELSQGLNEAIFSIYGTHFHLLDENPEYGLYGPSPDTKMPFWFNVMVPDITATFAKAMEQGCQSIQPITEIPEHNVSNAIFLDPFGYVWLIHQIHKATE